ncbi:MAG: hypothetical protein ACKV2V_03695 [Blastocatellia bacterium]
MTTVLAILILAFACLLFTALILRHTPVPAEMSATDFYGQPPRSLFSHPETVHAKRLREELEDSARRTGLREELLCRAEEGDLSALRDAFATNEKTIYRDTLNTLVRLSVNAPDAAGSLKSLAAYLVRDGQMRGSVELAAELIALWKQAPDRPSLGEMLHLTALSDDPTAYRTAVEIALEKWKANCLPDVAAAYLMVLVESEFWVISSEARRGGAGFVLRKYLSEVRRQLAAADGQQPA